MNEEFLPEYSPVILIHLCKHHILHSLGLTAKVPWEVTGGMFLGFYQINTLTCLKGNKRCSSGAISVGTALDSPSGNL